MPPQPTGLTDIDPSALSGSTGATLAAQVLYPDVATNHTHRDDIEALAAQGIFDGTDCGGSLFCPNDPIDRKSMAVWVVRVLDGRDPPRGSSRFPDVDRHLPAFWSPFVERMAELGVTRGCGDGTNFCPNDAVTRAQMAVFLTRAFNLPGGPDPGFSDVGQNHWASVQIAALAASGITRGCATNRYCPEQPTTRAQMATFLNRAISLDQSEEDEEELIDEEDSAGEVHVLHVFYCGPQGVYDQARLDAETARFNTVISRFYRQQSRGAVDLRFEAGGIVSPNVDWNDHAAHNIDTWNTPRNRAGPCNDLIPNMPPVVPTFAPDEEWDLIVVLAHIPPGPRDGSHVYGYSGPRARGPIVVSTVEMVGALNRYSSAEHLGLIAHEIGHLLWDFNHPKEQDGRTDRDALTSIMSSKGDPILDLSRGHIACYQRQAAGWIDSDNCDETTDDATAPEERPAPGGADCSEATEDDPELTDNIGRYNWYEPPADVNMEGFGSNGFRFTTAIGRSSTVDSWARWDFESVDGRCRIEVHIPARWATAHAQYHIWVDSNSDGRFDRNEYLDGPWLDQQTVSGWQTLGIYDLDSRVRIEVRDTDTRDDYRDVGTVNARLAVDAIRLQKISTTTSSSHQ